MRVLIDTHAFIWFISGNPALPLGVRQLIADLDHEVYISIASLWEIAIKSSLGKLTLHEPFESLITEQLALNEIIILPIQIQDLTLVSTMTFHHRDPFDRLIIAQALAHSLAIVTKDEWFASYDVETIW